MAWCKLMKTGQTTSYRTGDDGDLEAGRDVDFTTLDANNPFGNTNRFTDELGGQTYTNNIVIDWSTYDGATVLGWYKSYLTTQVWDDAIDNALTVSVGSFTTGWKLPNRKELESLVNSEQSNCMNYSPFSFGSITFWSSTTRAGTTTAAMTLVTSTHNILQQAKTSTFNVLPCRIFTVTGTTLS